MRLAERLNTQWGTKENAQKSTLMPRLRSAACRGYPVWDCTPTILFTRPLGSLLLEADFHQCIEG